MSKRLAAAAAVSFLALSSTAQAANVWGPIFVDVNQVGSFTGSGTYGDAAVQAAKYENTLVSPGSNTRVNADQAAIHAQAVALSNSYNGLARSTYSVDWTAKTLTGTAGVNVIDLDTDKDTGFLGLAGNASGFAQPGIPNVIDGLTFVPNGATMLIFNIKADSNNSFGSGSFSFDPGGLGATQVIFNFLGIDQVFVSGTGLVQGTILAPYANVKISGGSTVTGRIDGKSFEGSGGPGIAAPVIPGVPEPATWGMMILGFGLIGGVLRRQQKQSLRFA